MHDHQWLAEQFENYRNHLRSVAYRMLGSMSEADDAVQAAWLNVSRADTDKVENLGGWLTTIVARVCLDLLRARKAHWEENIDTHEPMRIEMDGIDPEYEALLADSVGIALLVILNTLSPDERLAFVLHDVFAMPFEEIAPIVGRSAEAARQLASRARRRVRGTSTIPTAELAPQRDVVKAFLAATRAGDFAALLEVLDPDVISRTDAALVASGEESEVRGAAAVAQRFLRRGGARAVYPVLIDDVVGLMVAPQGKLKLILKFTIANGKVISIDGVGDPAQLSQIELTALVD